MTASLPTDTPAVSGETVGAPATTSASGLEVVALGLSVAVGVTAWVSFLLAHAGHHSLTTVGLGTACVLGAAALALRGLRAHRDRAGTVVALGCVAVALALTLPGFSYGVADKDPGIYVQHAISIARTGKVGLHDDLLTRNAHDPAFPVRLASPGARFPGIWVQNAATGEVRPQFFHLWPSLLATAYEAGGLSGVRTVTPLIGALAVLVLCALLRRVGDLLAPKAGLPIAAVGGALLATNMMQVWQARYPTTEVLSQLFFLTCLLGLVVALHGRSAPAAAAAGLAIGWGWLNRPDGVLLVLLAVGVGAAVLAMGRWDRRSGWFATGLAVVVPSAVWQAYGYAKVYNGRNGVPSLPTLAVLAGAVIVTGLALRAFARGPLERLERWVLARGTQQLLGRVVVIVVVGMIVVGFLRPRLFGEDMLHANDGSLLRSFDEQNMRRLSWFITLPAVALLPVGVATVALRRWRAVAWVVVLPTLLFAPLYVLHGRNSSRLMWWVRRYVPNVLPGLIVLIALALGLALVHRYRGRRLLAVPAALGVLALLAVQLHQSIPVRRHDEFKTSFAFSAKLAALSHARQGIYLWEPDATCCGGPSLLFSATMWLQYGELSALLADPDNGPSPKAMLDAYRAAYPDTPLFVLSGTGQLPRGVDPARVHEVADLSGAFPVWDESDQVLPETSHSVPVRVTVWEVTA